MENSMLYVPYVWITYKNGLIDTTKFMNELDLSSIKVNDEIINFYNEKYPLYNLNGVDYSLTSNGFIGTESLGEKNTIHRLLGNLMSEMKNVRIVDLHGSSRGESMYGEIENSLKKYNILIEKDRVFSLDNYLSIRNSLVYETSFLTNISSYPYSLLINLFDGFLYREGFIKSEEGVLLAKKEEDVDCYTVSYSDLNSTFNNFLNFVGEINKVEKLNGSLKKSLKIK